MNYYNEFDPKAAAWLRELMAEGLIPKGEVDERSITDVRPDDLRGFTQCHFFAGIGGWSLALRLAGWPEGRPVWTGSCPCPPFSCAGKKKSCPKCGGRCLLPHPFRTGVFACCDCGHEWLADARHLWPDFYRLISVGQPPIVFGEQVAGADGEIWLAGIRACLEIAGYGVGGGDIPAASVGAPHKRQRLYWVAYAKGNREGAIRGGARQGLLQPNGSRANGIMADPKCCRYREEQHSAAGLGQLERNGEHGGMAHTEGGGLGMCVGASGQTGHTAQRESYGVALGDAIQSGLEGHAGNGHNGNQPGRNGTHPTGPVTAASAVGGMVHTNSAGPQPGSETAEADRHGGSAVTAGFWHDAIWHQCRDGKARRISPKPALFPLAHGLPGRVGLLRGAGNAIVPELAAEFIKAVMEVLSQ